MMRGLCLAAAAVLVCESISAPQPGIPLSAEEKAYVQSWIRFFDKASKMNLALLDDPPPLLSLQSALRLAVKEAFAGLPDTPKGSDACVLLEKTARSQLDFSDLDSQILAEYFLAIRRNDLAAAKQVLSAMRKSAKSRQLSLRRVAIAFGVVAETKEDRDFKREADQEAVARKKEDEIRQKEFEARAAKAAAEAAIERAAQEKAAAAERALKLRVDTVLVELKERIKGGTPAWVYGAVGEYHKQRHAGRLVDVSPVNKSAFKEVAPAYLVSWDSEELRSKPAKTAAAADKLPLPDKGQTIGRISVEVAVGSDGSIRLEHLHGFSRTERYERGNPPPPANKMHGWHKLLFP